MWVLFSLVDSAVVVYRKYVRSMSREEEEALWRDYRVIGRLFGLSDSDMPGTLDDLERYRREMLDGDSLHVSQWARRRSCGRRSSPAALSTASGRSCRCSRSGCASSRRRAPRDPRLARTPFDAPHGHSRARSA
jgi:hypothetical protein